MSSSSGLAIVTSLVSSVERRLVEEGKVGWRTLCKKSGSSLVGVVIVVVVEAVDWRFGECGGVDESCVLLRLVFGFGVAGVGAVALPNISSWLADVS